MTRAGGPPALAPYRSEGETDVCLLVEGCYPFVPGGVSSWIDWLMRQQPQTTFSVVSLWPRPTDQPPRYVLPENVSRLHRLYLQDFGAPPSGRGRIRHLERLADLLNHLVTVGGLDSLRRIVDEVSELGSPHAMRALFNSPDAWHIVQRMYHTEMPYGSFLHYFWAWRALLGGIFATLEFELPRAKLYHAISTGYAGVLAARAGLETGRPVLLTEHGIYTNERRIELLMADWVADTVDKGHALDDPRFDLRDMWVRAFEAFARTCYEACSEVVTLYEDNQRVQRVLGAAPDRLRVIANGIDVARYAGLQRAGEDQRPTMALIGRVVPIKDVKAFIAAARILRDKVPALRAWVMGPLDEDVEYVAECRAFAQQIGADDVVTFTGGVDITRYLPEVHVAVLSSLSESQPLVVLEAGAAGIPFVATNVGSCREIIEGRADETPALGPGGVVVNVVSPDEIAEAVGGLLGDPGRRRRYGEALSARVAAYYRSEQAVAAYRDLYAHHIGGAR